MMRLLSAPARAFETGDPDAGLAARAAAGDESAFEDLVARHEAALYSLARRMLGDREEAMDAVQEVFLRAYRSLRSFRGGCRLRTWLFAIGINVCRNRLVSAESRRRRLHVSLQQPDREDGAPVPLPLPDPAPGPEVRAWAGELRAALERALGELPAEQCEAIVLREMHGLEYEEIARALGCAVGTVKSRLSRARGALRVALEGIWP